MGTKSVLRKTSILLVLSVEMAINGSFVATAKPSQSVNPLSNRQEALKAGVKGFKFKIPGIKAASGNRIGGAVRGTDCVPKGDSIIALLPDTNIALTANGFPTLFVYIPATNAKEGEFNLYEEANGNDPVYSTEVAVSKTPGIASISIPANAKGLPLQYGKKYKWSFSLICDAGDRAGDTRIEGWLQREQQTVTLVNNLRNVKNKREIPSIYAEAGYWEETLTSLAALRRENPNDAGLKQDWQNLLNDVGLGKIAPENLVECCKTEVTSAELQ
jgi:hypothetical protein